MRRFLDFWDTDVTLFEGSTYTSNLVPRLCPLPVPRNRRDPGNEVVIQERVLIWTFTETAPLKGLHIFAAKLHIPELTVQMLT